MQHLKVSGAVRPLKWPLGVKWLKNSYALVKLNNFPIFNSFLFLFKELQ